MSSRPMFALFMALGVLAAACSGSPGSGSATAPAGASSPDAGPSATPAPRTAQFSELRNTVEARDEADADWQAAAEGQQIESGGGARTGDEARARLDISDGSIVRLAPNTLFELAELSPQADDPVTRFTLEAGKMWVSVSKALGIGQFEVETPVGVATVRGSLMSTEFFPANGHMIVTCLDGLCRLTSSTSGRFTDLVGGQQSGIPGFGQDPGPAIPIDSSQLSQWAGEFPEASAFVVTITPGPPPTPTPTPGPGGGAAGGVGQTACDHPYFPLRAGASWSYTTSEGAYSWVVNSVSGDTSSAAADMSWTFTGAEGTVQGTYAWQCDSAGIVSYEFGSLSVGGFGEVGTYQLVEHSGTFLPPAELLVPGYSWTNSYTTQSESTVGGVSVTGTSSVSQSLSVVGTEPVTVGGETYEGIQIAFTSSMEIQVQVPGVPTSPTQLTGSGTYVLARGVGFVRIASTTDGLTSTTELVSFSIP